MSDPLHLLVPYATSHSAGGQHALQGLALPHLDQLLARLSPADASPGEETSLTPPHERALALALGLPAEDGRTPWAAWHRHQQGQPPGDTAWAFITPCQWQVTTDHILLHDPAALALDDAASRELLDIVAPWFAEDGITLHYDQPTRWLASGPVFAELATASLDRVLERDVRPWLADRRAALVGRDARTLHRLQSEMQMLLYTHAFNDARTARGLPGVNSFWVHGAGALPPGLKTPAQPPRTAPTLREAALREDWRAWASAWAALDAGPVAELLQQAERGAPVRLTLCGERSAQSFHTAPRGLVQRVQSFFRPYRFLDVREKL